MRLSFADGLFWLSVACCVIAQTFIIRSVQSTRNAPEAAATVPRARHSVEVLWAILPALALAVLLAFTWRAIRARPDRPEAQVHAVSARM